MEITTVVLICVISSVLFSIIFGILAFFIGIAYRKKVAETEFGSAEEQAMKIINDAMKSSENKRKESLLEAKDDIHKLRLEANQDIKERHSAISRQETRLQQKEESLDKKLDNMEKKEEKLLEKEKRTNKNLSKSEELKNSRLDELEKIAGLTSSEAKKQILERLENELIRDKAIIINQFEQQTKDDSEKLSRDIISLAISRFAADHVSEMAVSVVSLPSDDMKGRIIGREGRNIRTLETLTGVSLIIDDTPEVITLSCFDPVRREIARISLEKLIEDGRIHPSRIEEMVEKAKLEVEDRIKSDGERAVLEIGIIGVSPDLIKLIGRLRYRTSYGQNVLKHSIEVAHLSGMMASELGLDPMMARRAGLIHDIGKGLTHEIEGSHVDIGVSYCKKFKEHPDVIHAVEAHHGDVDAITPLACIVKAADAISAARPGARQENLENYVKRLEKLEQIACSFDGVEKSFAIQAGREVRIIINPEEVSDDQIVIIARGIVKKIEEELQYPGQIKVHVVRESRVVEYAK
ncbi:MAG: ribonuclease Y [Oscillospiraceae bacterium]|nr:ribonuclease Y [Oscillospiraceae bacterium]